jgi:Arc/MetJ family transcription regulator
MRTNIVIDDKLMARAQELSGIDTKRQVVDEALRLFIRINEQKTVRKLRGKLTWEGDLGEQRRSRIKGA